MPNEVRDRRVTKHFITDHLVVDEYLPALSAGAFRLYSVFCRIASAYSKVFPSYQRLQSFLGCSSKTVAKSIKELEIFELIKVERNLSQENGNENNIYWILEPKHLDPALIKTIAEKLKNDGIGDEVYPKDWQPLLKKSMYNTPLLSVGKEGVLSPGKQGEVLSDGKQALLSSGKELVSEGKSINKDLKNVVVMNKTTTANIAKLAEAALPYCKTDSGNVVVSMEVIFKSALDKHLSETEAYDYVLDKINSFDEYLKKAENPLAVIHLAVKNNWQDARTLKKKESTEFNKIVKLKNEEQEKRIKAAWANLSQEKKALLYKDGLKWEYHKVNKTWPADADLNEMMAELIKNGKYGIYDLSIPSPYFRSEE